jgi:hypothetical protein
LSSRGERRSSRICRKRPVFDELPMVDFRVPRAAAGLCCIVDAPECDAKHRVSHTRSLAPVTLAFVWPDTTPKDSVDIYLEDIGVPHVAFPTPPKKIPMK